MSWQSETTVERKPEGERAGRIPTLTLLFSPLTGVANEPFRRLARGETPIGRSVASHGITLDDPSASRHHASVHVEGERVRVVDHSKNGTFVDAKRVGDEAIEDSALIRMGDAIMLFRWRAERIMDGEAAELIGRAPEMRRLRREIQLVAASDATVLVTGESGSGKELVARALHQLSERKGRFIALNASAIVSTLAESELFGHASGAFTGAEVAREGYLRAANGGTFFLDEVGELPAAIQPKLLRALEERCVTPVGSTEPVPIDVRFVAATHRDLEDEVRGGSFRGDLFARLAEWILDVPPLRDRREDVLILLSHFLAPSSPALDADLAEALILHPWPYNVRELAKVAKELSIRGKGEPKLTRSLVEHRLDAPRPESRASALEPPDRGELERLLAEHRGNIAKISRALGRSRRQVYRYLEEHGLDLERFR
jgi:DNA-binding NtrC family response regulator